MTERTARIWPTHHPERFRIEYDPQDDGRFSGIWARSEHLRAHLLGLFPDMPDEDLHDVAHALSELVRARHTDRFVELRRALPRPVDRSPAVVSDFTF